MVEVMKITVTSFKRSMHALPHSVAPALQQATVTHASAGDSWTLQGKSGQFLLGSLLLSHGSWCTQVSVCALPESVSPGLCNFCNQIPQAPKVKFPGGSQSLCQIPRLGNLLWVLELS